MACNPTILHDDDAQLEGELCSVSHNIACSTCNALYLQATCRFCSAVPVDWNNIPDFLSSLMSVHVLH